MEPTWHACSPLISLPLLTFLFLFSAVCQRAGLLSLSLHSVLLGQTGDSTGPATEKLCAPRTSELELQLPLAFSTTVREGMISGKAGSLCLTPKHRLQLPGAHCQDWQSQQRMTFQILEPQHCRLLNKTNKQTITTTATKKTLTNKPFGVNHVCIGLDVFEMEASKVTLVIRDEWEEVGPSGRCPDLVV